MKYIRVVLAVTEEPPPSGKAFTFDEELDIFIEECDYIVGAYVSDTYDDRVTAVKGEWKEKPPIRFEGHGNLEGR